MWLERLKIVDTVLYRLAAVVAVALLLGWWKGAAWAFGFASLAFAVEIAVHLMYVSRLVQWIDEPMLDSLPACSSRLWGAVFGSIYKSQKALDKNTRRLAAREDRYRKTLAALPEGIALVKADWALSWCNQNAEQILGADSEGDAGTRLTNLVIDEHFTGYLRARKFDVPLTWAPAHSDRQYSVRIVVVDRKNALIILRDVTEQMRLEAMRRDFVANVSHELRTPLTVLSGFLDIASQGLDKNGKGVTLSSQHLTLMREQASRMQHLVNDLLTLSRLESESEGKKTEIIDLAQLINTITKEIQVMAAKTHTVDCSVQQLSMVGFPDEIRSAIVNLMTNAVRYTPAGGHVHAGCRLDASGRILVSVQDDGIGIEKKDIPRLTERFYRVDKSRSRDTGGTGLGLAIVKHVLLRHKGQLKIESEPGKGSTFTLVFPVSCRPSQGAVPTAGQPAAQKKSALMS